MKMWMLKNNKTGKLQTDGGDEGYEVGFYKTKKLAEEDKVAWYLGKDITLTPVRVEITEIERERQPKPLRNIVL